METTDTFLITIVRELEHIDNQLDELSGQKWKYTDAQLRLEKVKKMVKAHCHNTPDAVWALNQINAAQKKLKMVLPVKRPVKNKITNQLMDVRKRKPQVSLFSPKFGCINKERLKTLFNKMVIEERFPDCTLENFQSLFYDNGHNSNIIPYNGFSTELVHLIFEMQKIIIPKKSNLKLCILIARYFIIDGKALKASTLETLMSRLPSIAVVDFVDQMLMYEFTNENK